MRIMTYCDANHSFLMPHLLFNHPAYCARHGHSWTLVDRTMCPDRPVAYNRILMMQDALQTMATGEWMLYIDADAFFVDINEDIASRTMSDKDMVIAVEPTGLLNCGVWLVRKSDWTKSFLEALWADRDYDRKQFAEQQYVQDHLKANLKHIGIGRHDQMNSSHWYYKTGDPIIHFVSYHKPLAIRRGMVRWPEVAKALGGKLEEL
jgi:hypothetical protein